MLFLGEQLSSVLMMDNEVVEFECSKDFEKEVFKYDFVLQIRKPKCSLLE